MRIKTLLTAMLMLFVSVMACDAFNSTDLLNSSLVASNLTDCIFIEDLNTTLYYPNSTIIQTFNHTNIYLNSGEEFNLTERNTTMFCEAQTPCNCTNTTVNQSFPFLYVLLNSSQQFNDTARNVSVLCNATNITINSTVFLYNCTNTNTTIYLNNTVYLDNCTQVNDTVYINNCTTVNIQNITVVNQTCTNTVINNTVYVQNESCSIIEWKDIVAYGGTTITDDIRKVRFFCNYTDKNLLNLTGCRNTLRLNLSGDAIKEVCADNIESLCPVSTLIHNDSLAECFLYVLNPLYSRLYQMELLLNASNARADDNELKYQKEKDINTSVWNEILNKLALGLGIIMLSFLGKELYKIMGNKKTANMVSRMEKTEDKPLPLRRNDNG